MVKHKKWTSADIPELTGKVVVVTGASSGIGLETAKELARKGAETILACRSLDRGQRALNEIQARIPEGKATLMQLDLASLTSIERFTEQFRDQHKRLDVLVNNAGIMGGTYTKTEDGFERQIGTNHLGHFALTGQLVDVLLSTPGARVVTVSSLGHRQGHLDFDNLLYEKGDYGGWAAYFRTKLLNLLFTYELQRLFEKSEAKAYSLAAHPGFSATQLATDVAKRWKIALLFRLFNTLVQGPDIGALPTLRAATDPKAKGGQYYGPRGWFEERGYPVVVSSSEASHSEKDARHLWEISENLTGVRYSSLTHKDSN